MYKRNYKTEFIIAILFLLLIIVFIVSFGFYQQNEIRQKYLEKGIYEVDGTFGLGANNFLHTVFMICEPPSDKDELERVVIDFMEKNNIVQTIKVRKIDYYGVPTEVSSLNIVLIDLYFVKPSKSYPIGWNRGEEAGFFSGFITDHTIINVRVPWDSTDSSDIEFFYYSD